MNISVAQARAAIAALLPAPPSVTVNLLQSYNLVLASDLLARVDHPSSTQSALDGVACRAADTAEASSDHPTPLQLIGESRAGLAFSGVVGPGQAMYIYTGASMPHGADAICPVEQLSVEGDTVYLRRPAQSKDVRQCGEDFTAGDVVLRAGERLTPARVALAAAAGHAQVTVQRPWRVAVLATGDEVIEPPMPLLPGQVYNSNTYGLYGLLQEAGCQVTILNHVPDSLPALHAQLAALPDLDLLLTSGGVSMGKYDLVRDLLMNEGQVSFWKVKMRPGGPVIAGRWNTTAVVGLPGNPVSSLVVFQVMLRPVLTGEPPRTVRLPAYEPLRSVVGKTAFWRANIIQRSAGGSQVALYHHQGSGILRSLSESGALVCIPEGEDIQAGDWAEVWL